MCIVFDRVSCLQFAIVYKQGLVMIRYSYALLICLPFEVVYAGGLLSYEIGTPDLGLASAGYAARAQDAATAMTNPAGMTRLYSTELMVGLQPLYGQLTFTPNGNTTVSGGDGGNAIGWFPGGGGFFVYSATPDLKFGLCSYGNFGMPLHYDGGWVGRYDTTSATLLGITVAPSIAYRIHEMWSVGLSFNAMYAMLSQKAAVNNSPLGLFGAAPDGEVTFKKNTWGYGVTFGFLFEPTVFTRFGLTYTTQMDLSFDDTIEFADTFPIIVPSGNFSTPFDLKMTVPKQVMGSFYHEWTDCIAFLGNLGWQNWEQFARVDIGVTAPNGRTFTYEINYKNTWHGALGLQILLGSDWRLSFGTAYDSEMVNTANRTASLPIGSAWRLGSGVEYRVRKNFSIGAAYTWLYGGDVALNENRGILMGHVAGDYYDSAVNYFGINFDWAF